MKQNITLSLDKEVIRKGKILAAKKESSISRMLAETLKSAVEKECAPYLEERFSNGRSEGLEARGSS
jgi:hypothetical protein